MTDPNPIRHLFETDRESRASQIHSFQPELDDIDRGRDAWRAQKDRIFSDTIPRLDRWRAHLPSMATSVEVRPFKKAIRRTFGRNWILIKFGRTLPIKLQILFLQLIRVVFILIVLVFFFLMVFGLVRLLMGALNLGDPY